MRRRSGMVEGVRGYYPLTGPYKVERTRVLSSLRDIVVFYRQSIGNPK